MVTAKEILDKYALIVVENNAIFQREGFDQVDMHKKRRYENGGYNKDIVLWIPPLDCIRAEFEDTIEKNSEYITQMEAACKASNIDCCVTFHNGGKSPYLNIFNIKNIPLNEDNKIAKLLWIERLLPSGAKKQLDRTNLGWTLSPVIGHPHWKKKYKGSIHEIKTGKNPLAHINEYPKELLKELKIIKKQTLKNANTCKEISPWVEDFLFNFCCNNELPKGQRHHVIEKNLAAFIIHRQDKEQIEEQYLKAQGRSINTLRTWYTAILNKQFMEVSPGELYNYIKDNELNYHVEKKEENKQEPITLQVDNYISNVSMYHSINPFFYDKSKIFWLWNKIEYKYEIVDDIDLMNKIDSALGLHGQTVTAKVKMNYMEAFKRIGRLHHPKEAPVKWIQFKDKAFSLTSKQIYKVTPEYFFTNPIPHELSNNDKTPIMDKLFEEWVGKEYVEDLYQICAYCVYREYPIQLLFCFCGSGRNGKSQFMNALDYFIGKQNTTATELDTLLNSRFESFKLYRKLMCIIGETNFGILTQSSLLKKLVGGDKIGFEKKNKDPFDEYNYAKMIIASNSLPSSNDTSDGFYRRWHIIDFPNEFNETGIDIWKTIPIEEYSALANKITKILPLLLKEGKFKNQGSIEQRKKKYIEESNPLRIFIDNHCELDDDECILYSRLYTHYIKFLAIKKKRKVKMKEFKSALEDEGLFVEKDSIRNFDGDFKSGYYIKGIKYLDNLDNLDNNSTQPPTRKNQYETLSKLSKLSKKGINEEFITSDEELIHLKCSICGETPCMYFNKIGKPLCINCLKT